MTEDPASDSDIDLDEIGPARPFTITTANSKESCDGYLAPSPSKSAGTLDFDGDVTQGSHGQPRDRPAALEPGLNDARHVNSEVISNQRAIATATRTNPAEFRSHVTKRTTPSEPEPWLFPPDYADTEFSDEERLDRLERRPHFAEILPQRVAIDVQLPVSKGVIPSPIAQWLRDYQILGASFMHKLFTQQRGGILGDDMGLGKTVQVIAFLTAAFGKTGDSRDSKRRRKVRNQLRKWYPRILLVCPTSLMENWKDELNRWGWWEIGVYHGLETNKIEALEAAENGYIEIMITTYTTYAMNQWDINRVEWDCVIADECHCLKGRAAQITLAMNEINAKCRIGLTGTAVQNNYDELWSLLNWANPGLLGSATDWSHSITEPLKRGQSHDATLMELGKARRVARRLVQNLLPKFFLRRTKALIADQLPRKYDRVVFCPLTETQTQAYKAFLSSNVVQYVKMASQECDCGSEASRGWCCYKIIPGYDQKWQSFVFPVILALSKISNHIALLQPNVNQEKDKQERDLTLFKLALPDSWKYYHRRLEMDNFTDLELFGKWKVLRKLLAFWEPKGDKVLVFSHSTRLLEVLRVLFTSTAYTVCYLDGKMTLQARAAEVVKFNTSPNQFIFCISTKAGGVGLNITSANKVIIMDPNWNPAYDLQAQDRAYRIGQRRDVEVFRLVSSGTIEEAIYARQIYKQQQAAIAYTASNERRHFRGVLGSSDKGDIFGLDNLLSFSNELRLKDILDKTDIAETRAGLKIVSLNVSEANADEDEDAAISQFAHAISQGKSAEVASTRQVDSQADPVQAILSQAGIAYTHDNKEILGSSRVESELSAQAQSKGLDSDRAGRKAFEDGNVVDDGYQWHPAEAIRKRQFQNMATAYGEDIQAFAVRIENWTTEERRNFLDDYYSDRHRLKKVRTQAVEAPS